MLTNFSSSIRIWSNSWIFKTSPAYFSRVVREISDLGWVSPEGLWKAIMNLASCACELIDVVGFNVNAIQSADADDMDSGDFIFGGEGDKAEFFNRFGF
jgi:hypothetical protein